MKKINLKGISESLTQREFKNILGGSGTGNHSMKCYNTVTSCWVDACPGSRSDAETLCMTDECGNAHGEFMSCS